MSSPKKFKAWDKKNNEWYMEGNIFDLNYSGEYGIFLFDNDHPANMRDVELEWVQFTGLKDKNGVETYFGQRLKDKAGKEYQIVWVDLMAAFWVIQVEYPYKKYTAELISKLEVIDDIHTNPELLEAKDAPPNDVS